MTIRKRAHHRAMGRHGRLRSRHRTSGSPQVDNGAGAAPDAVLRHMFGRDFVYVLGGVLPLAVSALILPALTRLMGREQFGIVSLAIAISSVLSVLLTFGMQIGVQREFPKQQGNERAREFVTISAFCIIVVGAGLTLTVHAWAAVVGAGSFAWAMQYASIYSAASAVALVCLGVLRSSDRLPRFLTIVLMQSIGGQLIGAALLVTQGHTASQYLLGLVIGQIVAAILALTFVRPRLPRIVKPGAFFRSLTFTLPLIVNQLANFLLWSGDRIVVQRDLGSIAQARYAVAYAAGAIAINITAQLNQAWMPRVFAITNVEHRRQVLIKVQRQLTGLLSPGVLTISLAAPFLLIAASPPSYDPYKLVLVTVLIVPTALPYSVALANTRTLLAHGKSARLAASTAICAALNIGLNVLWVPQLGITGSALATLVAYACQAWLSGILVWSEADRLPGRFASQLLEWTVMGACIATVLFPSDLLGLALRTAGLAVALVIFLLQLRRTTASRTMLGSSITTTDGPRRRHAKSPTESGGVGAPERVFEPPIGEA